MTFNREEVLGRYIKKVNSDDLPEKKMKRNLQPEIEKIKSVQNSIYGRYINQQEKKRLLDEVRKLQKSIECI